MNDIDGLIESLKRKNCTVEFRPMDRIEVRADGQHGDQCWIMDLDQFRHFVAGFNIAFHMMAKRHREFVAMMKMEDVS